MATKVTTPFGEGELEEIRDDDVHVVRSSWAVFYLNKSAVTYVEEKPKEPTANEMIDEAIQFTETGNGQFKKQELNEAVYSYLRALNNLQRVDQDHATHKQKASILQTMIRCHLNLGACKLKLDAYQDADTACTNAISILKVLGENQDGNVAMWMGRLGVKESQMLREWPSKARFRRAQARFKLGRYADAKQDLVVTVRLSPKDSACRQLLEQVTQLLNQQRSKEKQAWGGIFEKPKEQKPEPWYSSGAALATASVLAGVAAVTMFALRQR